VKGGEASVAHVADKIGPIARPDDIFFTAESPKTRRAKIMRRPLRDSRKAPCQAIPPRSPIPGWWRS
jgi:acyl-coenzyme A synthetase/AMP-(fatty) acid ligase